MHGALIRPPLFAPSEGRRQERAGTKITQIVADDLGRLLGERSLGPAILRGDRELSEAHVRTRCAHFKVSPAVFIRPEGGAEPRPGAKPGRA